MVLIWIIGLLLILNMKKEKAILYNKCNILTMDLFIECLVNKNYKVLIKEGKTSSPGWKGLHSIVETTIQQLKWWLKHGDTKRQLSPEHLPTAGFETMNKSVTWDSANNPSMSIENLVYEIRRADDDGLLLDSVCLADIYEGADEKITFDALVSPYNRLERKMQILKTVMEKSSDGVKPLAMQISDPFKSNGTAQVAVVFELSDGQTLSIFFHNPDVTPSKILPTDELVSWKWLLNKKDITIVVAPEKGKDLDVKQVAIRVMKLADKNSAAFQRANSKRAESMVAIESIKAEIPQLETELTNAQHELEVAKVERDDRILKADQDKREAASVTIGQVLDAMMKTHTVSAWWADADINAVITGGVKKDWLKRRSETQVEWTKKGSAAAAEYKRSLPKPEPVIVPEITGPSQEFQQEIFKSLIDLGWENQTGTSSSLISWVTKTIGGGYAGGMINPNGDCRLSAKIRTNSLDAMHGDSALVSVPLDLSSTPAENAKRLDDAVNAIDPRQSNPEVIAPAPALMLPDKDFKIDIESLYQMFPALKPFGVTSATILTSGDVAIVSDWGTDNSGIRDEDILNAWRANDLLELNDESEREDALDMDNSAFETFRQIHQFAEPGEEYDVDSDQLYDLEASAFLVDRSVRANNGLISWGSYDVSANTASLFDSATLDWSEKAEENEDAKPNENPDGDESVTHEIMDASCKLDSEPASKDENAGGDEAVTEEVMDNKEKPDDKKTDGSPKALDSETIDPSANKGAELQPGGTESVTQVVLDSEDVPPITGGAAKNEEPDKGYEEVTQEVMDSATLDSETVKPITAGCAADENAGGNEEVTQTIMSGKNGVDRPIAGNTGKGGIDPSFNGGIEIPDNSEGVQTLTLDASDKDELASTVENMATLDAAEKATHVNADGLPEYNHGKQLSTTHINANGQLRYDADDKGQKRKVVDKGPDCHIALTENGKLTGEITWECFKKLLNIPDDTMTMDQAIAQKNAQNVIDKNPVVFVNKATFDAVYDEAVSPGSIIGQIADSSGGHIVARIKIDLDGAVTVYKGASGTESIAEGIKAVSAINTAISEAFSLSPAVEGPAPAGYNPSPDVQMLQDIIGGKFDTYDLNDLLDRIDACATALTENGHGDEYDAIIGAAAEKWAQLDEKANG